MNGVSQQRQTCLEAWINCENLLASLSQTDDALLLEVANTVDECARICMETWQALKTRTQDGRKMVLLCIGICEDCADLCEQYTEPQIRQCARSCRNCANSFAQLALASAYN